MRTRTFFLWIAAAASTASCAPQCCYDPCCDVIQETYVHKYGVEVCPQDWSARGQCGQVISTLKDGTTETRNYDNGVLHGECSYTFPHSSLTARKDSYHQGALLSQTHYYRSGGAYQEIVPLSETRRQITTWYESGEPKSIEEYDQQLLVTGIYYTKDHTIEARVDDSSGIRVNRDAYGQLISREEISGGVAAKQTTFHPNGSPHVVTPLAGNLPEGTIQEFLPDGEPLSIKEVHQGVQDGWTVLYENGEVVSKIPYQNGSINGIEEHYKDGNILATQITWVAGMRHGPTFHYAGDNITTDWYFHDKLVSKSDYEILTNYAMRNRNID